MRVKVKGIKRVSNENKEESVGFGLWEMSSLMLCWLHYFRGE